MKALILFFLLSFHFVYGQNTSELHSEIVLIKTTASGEKKEKSIRESLWVKIITDNSEKIKGKFRVNGNDSIIINGSSIALINIQSISTRQPVKVVFGMLYMPIVAVVVGMHVYIYLKERTRVSFEVMGPVPYIIEALTKKRKSNEWEFSIRKDFQ